MKYETHSGGKQSAGKQQERIRFYESKVKERESACRKGGSQQNRK